MKPVLAKLSCALLGLGLGGLAIAGGYTPPKHHRPATIMPTSSAGYHFGLEALYVKEHNDADSLRYVSSNSASGSVTTIANYVAKPDWQWGFRIEGGYHDEAKNDYTLDWTHLNHDNKTVRTETKTSSFTLANLSVARDFAFATTSYRRDQINLAMGHTYEPNHQLVIRVHGGPAYSKVDHNLNAYSDLVTHTDISQLTYRQASQFDGFGIRTGADLDWDFGNDWYLFAKGAVSLLWGDLKASAQSHTLLNTKKRQSQSTIDTYEITDKQRTILPELQGEGGLAWQHDNWMLRGGWRHNVMIHALKYLNPTATHASVGETSNFAYGGAFLGIEWRSA